MRKWASYQESSRTNWGNEVEGTADGSYWHPVEKLMLGCMQRIATAVESMAKNHDELVRDRDFWKERADYRSDKIDGLRLSNAALRGYITKLKKGGSK